MPDVSSLVKKTYYYAKITEIEKTLTDHNHDNYITTPDFNALAAVFNARLARENLMAKPNFGNTVSSLDNKIATNKTKNDSTENEVKKLKRFNYPKHFYW